MAKTIKKTANESQEVVATLAPKSLKIADRGVSTSRDFARMMGALMADVASGRLSPIVANAMCNAGGKMLKVIEMQHKYGKRENGQMRAMNLIGSDDE